MLRVEPRSQSADAPDHRALTSLRWENPKRKVNNFNKTAIPSGSSSAAISKKKKKVCELFFYWCALRLSVSVWQLLKNLFLKKVWGLYKNNMKSCIIVLGANHSGTLVKKEKEVREAGREVVKRSWPLTLVQDGLSNHQLCCDHAELDKV